MVKKVYFLIFLFIFMLCNLVYGEEPVYLFLDAPKIEATVFPEPVVNLPDEDSLPRNWRTNKYPFKEDRIDGYVPVRDGLDNLNISGSGFFSQAQFSCFCKRLKDYNVTVVDLRQEPHGMINNMSISLYKLFNSANEGKELEEIIEDEKNLLKNLAEEKNIILKHFTHKPDPGDSSTWTGFDVPVEVEVTMTEEELVTSAGLDYIRIPVLDNHRPQDIDVDRFIELYRSLPPGQWVHFHCRAGKGRTTTFMTMYDMMKNYDTVSMEDIILRQYLLGGSDLLNFDGNKYYQESWFDERAEFINNFYQYCKECGPDYGTSWSEWVASRE